eukprot:jgi/Ulvmu1/3371/UM156_0028.1
MDQAGTVAAAILENWNSIDKNPPKEPGQVWYIVSKRWLGAFRSYISALETGESAAVWPGQVNNSDLVEDDVSSILAPFSSIETGGPDWRYDVRTDTSAEEYDYVPADVWHFLVLHFSGGPPIPRCCARDEACGAAKLEAPIHISILRGGHADALRVKVPPSLTYDELLRFAVKCLGLSNSCTLEDHSGDNVRDLGRLAKLKEEPTLHTLGVQDEMALRLVQDSPEVTSDAVMNETAPDIAEDAASDTVNAGSAVLKIADEHPVPAAAPKKLSLQHLQLPPPQPMIQPFRSADAVTEADAKGSLPGFVGLQNLGNTCFMNSALQCLSHCVPVLRVFLSSSFEDDLNPENPLGKKGEMAMAFGELAQKLWRHNVKYISPDGFKRTLGRHAAQFQGYEQHDSQEFLSYLLDMLHEDLNRVRNKPYIEEGEDAGRTDEELAEEAWNSYRARNDSAIVDHFQGLLKSTLDCPNCGHHKRKFDPFMYLSVPLPGANTVLRRFTFLPMEGSTRPREYCVKVYKHDTVGAFLEAVSLVVGLQGTAPQSFTAVLQKSSFSAYSRDREYCTLQVLEDVKQELPPERHSFNKDKLLVYHYPDDEVVGVDLKHAAIVPPGGTDSLPLMLRVPPTAIEVEPLSSKTSNSGPFSGHKRLSLRSDCELARRVEDLLTPFKKQRVQSNLIYTPPVPYCNGDVPQIGELGQYGSEAVYEETDVADVVDVEMCCSPSDTSTKLPTSGGAVEQVAGGAALGVPIHAVHRKSVDQATVEQAATHAYAMAQCAGPAGADHSDGFVEASPLTAEMDDSRSMSPCPGDSMQAPGVIALPHVQTQPIMGCVPEPTTFNLRGLTPDASGDTRRHLAGPTAPSRAQYATADGAQAHEQTSPEPAVRLLAVEGNGAPLLTPPETSSTQFFRLDVRMEDAKHVIDVEAMTKVDEHSSLDQLKEQREYTLEDCIGTYLAEEILGPADLWHCPKCRMDVRAKKALDVWCLPEVLIIHLKRFSYSGFGFYSNYSTTSSKINNLVTFPLKGLDMTSLVHGSDADAVYDCFAISNHMGSVSGGHYTAFCLHEPTLLPDAEKGLSWHSYNDRTVMPTSASSVVTPSAYVLFYRRRSCSLQDPADTLSICRQEMEQRTSQVQAKPPSNIVDLFPGKPRYAGNGSPAQSVQADSGVDVLPDNFELEEIGTDASVPSHQVNGTGSAPAPLDSTVLAQFQDHDTQHNDETDSQNAVVNFQTDPTGTTRASATSNQASHASGAQRPLNSDLGQQFQDDKMQHDYETASQKVAASFSAEPMRTFDESTPSSRGDHLGGAQILFGSTLLQRSEDEFMEPNDEIDSQQAVVEYATEASKDLQCQAVGGNNYGASVGGIANASSCTLQQHRVLRQDGPACLHHASRPYIDAGSVDTCCGPGLVHRPIMKVTDVNKPYAHLAGGSNGEVVEAIFSTDLPVASKEVSENDDVPMDDDCMEVGTPDQQVHGISRSQIGCPE